MDDDKSTAKRSKKLKANIIISVILKGLGTILSFMLLPLTVHYLSEVEYGVWVTLFSVLNWINMLDMGIGLGLRNKLAEAVAQENISDMRSYISTGIGTMLLIGLVFLFVFHAGMQFVTMQKLFNTTLLSENELYQATYYTGFFIIVSFVLSIINQIYYAYQKAAMVGGIGITHSLIMLMVVYYLTLQPDHQLLYFVFAFGIAMISSRLTFIWWFFKKEYMVIPRWRYFAISKVRSISKLGIRFFIIQICCIFGYTFNNFLITEFLGPECVRTFDILSKIISFSLVLQTLVTTPLWSAYTEAYVRRDYSWMRKAFWKSIYLTAGLIFSIVIGSFFMDPLIYLWMHIRLDYSSTLLCLIGLYYAEILICNALCMILNGIGDINVQLFAWIFAAVSVVPFTYFFSCVMGMGLEGIAFGMVLSMIWLDVVLPIKVWLLLKKWK